MLSVYVQRGMPRDGEVSFLVETDSVLSEEDALAIQNGEGYDVTITRPVKFRCVGKRLASDKVMSDDDRIIRSYEWSCEDIHYKSNNAKITTKRWA